MLRLGGARSEMELLNKAVIPSSVCYRRHQAAEGEGLNKDEKFAIENKLRPSSVNYVDSFPPRGSLYHRQSF